MSYIDTFDHESIGYFEVCLSIIHSKLYLLQMEGQKTLLVILRN